MYVNSNACAPLTKASIGRRVELHRECTYGRRRPRLRVGNLAISPVLTQCLAADGSFFYLSRGSRYRVTFVFRGALSGFTSVSFGRGNSAETPQLLEKARLRVGL